MIMIIFVNLINFFDRATVPAVLGDISTDLCSQEKVNVQCSDSKEGLLATMFTIVFFLVSPFIGYLGDRYNRKYIIVSGVCLWIAFSITSTFMRTYWPFLVFR